MSEFTFTPISDFALGESVEADPTPSMNPGSIPVTVQNNEPRKVVVVEDRSSQAFGWDDAIRGLESGSWAVLIAMGVTFFVFRKPFQEYVTKQFRLMESLEESTTENKTNIKQLADTDLKVAVTLEQQQENLKRTNETLEKTSATLDKLTDHITRAVVRQNLQLDMLSKLYERQRLIVPTQARDITEFEDIDKS